MIDIPGIAIDYAPLGQLPADGLGACPDWLTPGERAELARWRDPGRCRQWLGGRFLAKRLLARTRAAGAPLGAIEILSRDESGRAVRPRVALGGQGQPWALSISHSSRAALVAVGESSAGCVGVDLVLLEAVPRESLRAWLDEEELGWADPAGDEGAAAIWAIKEAVYKAANQGEGFAPRQVCVHPQAAGRYACRYRGRLLDSRAEIRTFPCDGHLAALARVPAPCDTPRCARPQPILQE